MRWPYRPSMARSPSTMVSITTSQSSMLSLDKEAKSGKGSEASITPIPNTTLNARFIPVRPRPRYRQFLAFPGSSCLSTKYATIPPNIPMNIGSKKYRFFWFPRTRCPAVSSGYYSFGPSRSFCKISWWPNASVVACSDLPVLHIGQACAIISGGGCQTRKAWEILMGIFHRWHAFKAAWAKPSLNRILKFIL